MFSWKEITQAELCHVLTVVNRAKPPITAVQKFKLRFINIHRVTVTLQNKLSCGIGASAAARVRALDGTRVSIRALALQSRPAALRSAASSAFHCFRTA